MTLIIRIVPGGSFLKLMRRRTVILLLVLSLAFKSFAQTFESGGIYYEVTDAENKLLTLIWGGNCKGDVILPGSVTYNGVEYTIDNIEDRAFYVCLGLTSIIIPEGVTRIGLDAFSYCSNLKSVTFPRSLAFVDGDAFFGCDIDSVTNISSVSVGAFSDNYNGFSSNKNKIQQQYQEWYDNQPDGLIRLGNVIVKFKGSIQNGTSITVPDGVTHIAADAFKDCKGLTSITLPSSVIYIGNSAFYGCEDLASITISDNIKYVGKSAFEQTAWYEAQSYGLTCLGNVVIEYKGDGFAGEIVIPNGMRIIANNAFNYKSFDTITIPSTVQSIGEQAFMHSSMSVINMSEGLKSIRMSAFCDCRSLANVSIPKSVVNMGNGVFQYCRGIKTVILPDGVTCIRDDMFSCCDSLETVTIPDGVVFVGEDAFEECYKLKSVNIPDKVRRIGQRAFKYCYSLESVVIPKGVKEIANNTFYRCSALATVSLPDSLEIIRGNAFNGCSKLTNVSLPDGLKTIEENAFYYCSGIEGLVIPESVDDIYSYAFYGCSDGLKSIVVASGNSRYDSRDNCNALIDTKTNTLVLGCMNTVIPGSVTIIGPGAFAYCTNLTVLTIPENVKSIMYDSFYGCTIKTLNWYSELSPVDVLMCCGGSLESVTFGGDYKRIHDGLFCYYTNCSRLTSVSLLEGVTGIGERAFATLTNLTSVVIPSSVGKIGDYAFDWCEKLTDVTISNGVDSIGNGAFSNCSSLSTITIPKSVGYIGDKVFEKGGLSQVMICGTPEIGANAFMSPDIESVICRSLTPGQIKYNNPFIAGEPEDVVVYGNRANVYDSTLCRTITKIEFSRNYNKNSCFVSMNNIPAGRYRISVGILNSPDTIPNSLHPVITARMGYEDVVLFDSVQCVKIGPRYITVPYVISNEDKYKVDTIVYVSDFDGTQFEDYEYKYTYNSSGYDTLTIVDEFVVPDSIEGLTLELLSQNGARYLLLDRVFIEPLDGMPSMDKYAGPFTENVFNNATLYVPEESVEAYRAADGWKLFRNIVADETVYPADEVEVTISGAGYATFYYSDGDYVLPEGLSAMVVSGMFNDKLVYEIIARGSDGGVIPAGVPVVLVSDNNKAGVYKLSLTYGVFEFNGLNLLIGSDTDTQTYAESSSRFYKLAYGPSGTDLSDVLGWYWGAADGGAFNIEAHKAWLALPKATTKGMAGFTLSGDATFVIDIESDKDDEMIIYDIYGRKLSVPTGSGMYIINGKKVVITK